MSVRPTGRRGCEAQRTRGQRPKSARLYFSSFGEGTLSVGRRLRRKTRHVYHFGQSSCCDDPSCVDEAVEESSLDIERSPEFVLDVVI